MDQRRDDGAGRGRPPGTRVRSAGVGVSRLDPGELEATETRRDPRAGLGLGSTGDRSAAHAIGRAVPVRRAHQQPSRSLSIRLRGRWHDRPQFERRPRRGAAKKRLIGTGPYILKEHTRKVRMVLTRNPDYFDKGRPYIDEYVILSTPDAATRLAAFRTGQSDILWVASLSEVEIVRKTNPSAVVQEVKNTLAPFGLALAQDSPPFNYVRVRRAISMAIDRQKQVDTVFEGHGMLGWGVPYIYYQDKPPTAAQLGPWWQFRPADAKKLLAEAGHPNGFETTLFYYEYYPQMTSHVPLLQPELKKNLNINIKITKLDYTTYYGRYVDSKWDGMSWGFQSGHAVGLDERTYQYMYSKSTKNFFRVNDPVIDDLTTKLRQTPDRADQRAITKKIVDREFDQVLRMWMPYDAGFFLYQPHLRNMAALALRRTDGYGSPTTARLWLDK